MAIAKPIVPPPRESDEKPFEVGDELTVFEAPMIYAGRHPPGRFVEGGNIADHLAFLQAGIDDAPTRNRIEAQLSWDIYCTLERKIECGDIRPVKLARDRDRKINPLLTVIRTLDLAGLATERGE